MNEKTARNFSEYITIQLTGGLGNQLFGLATVLSLAKRRGLSPAVSLFEFEKNSRKFELGSVCARSGIPFVEQEVNIYKEESIFEYNANIETVQGGTRLIGYFQDYKYFDDQREFVIDTLLSDLERESLKVPDQSIAVHIRRGDYLTPVHLKHHGICDFEYYSDSVSILRSIWGNLPVRIFSDDPFTAIEIGSIIPNSTTFNDDGLTPWEILLEMAKKKCLVASNSSFSWWSGYLSQKSYGDIIIPEPWINDKSNKSLKIPGWISLPRIGLRIPEVMS